MPILETYMLKGHNNIYKDTEMPNYTQREIRTEVVLPTNGTNESTGILVFIPGYGGNIDSHVWQRMRNEFCDQYNLITVQCDYFGNKYMNSEAPQDLYNFLETPNFLGGGADSIQERNRRDRRRI